MAQPAAGVTAALTVVLVAVFLAAGWWPPRWRATARVERRRPCGTPRSHVHTIRQTQLFDQETDHA